MPLKVSDGMDAWISDFKKSDAPQFKGKNEDEKRDMAIAAYLSAKRGPLKNERVLQDAMSKKEKDDLAKQVAAFKKKGGKVKKLKPGYAAGYHGKDDPGKDIAGILGKDDSSKFKKGVKVKPMRAGYNNTKEWQTMYGDLLSEGKSQGMFIVLEKGSKNKVIGQFKDKKKAIDMMKKNAGSKVIQIGKFATTDDKPVDIKVGDELSYTRVKLSNKIKEEVDKDPEHYDNEGAMAKDHLDIIMDAADHIYDLVESDQENLPEWVQKKITISADYIDGVRDYMMSQDRDEPEDAVKKESIDEATNMFTDDRVGFQIDRFSMGKDKGVGFQINYGKGRGKFIQVPMDDMKRVIAQMTKAMKAKI